MRYRCLLPALLLVLAPSAAVALEARFARRPALSPEGTQIAFCWRGDLWVVASDGGAARRLTVHPAYDTRPVWSPDGKTIAFASDRFGNYDIFVMSAAGGLPRRLTYHSSSDMPSTFTPDGKRILFMASRSKGVDRRSAIYQVPLAGGTPLPIFRAVGSEAQLSPDGSKLVMTRGVVPWFRKRYRGSAAHDVWLYDFRKRQFERLTEFAGNDDFPCFGPRGKHVYFRSDRKGLADLWRLELSTRKLTRMSQSRTQGIRIAHVAQRAPLAVYERWDALYTLDLDTRKERLVRIEVPADERENRIVRRVFRGRGVSEFLVTPDGKAVAFVIQGEVFVRELAAISKRAIQITRTTEAREQGLAWTADNKLVFVSDRSGDEQLYQVSGKGGKPIWKASELVLAQLTKGKLACYAPELSPDGALLAYVRGGGDLIVRDLASGKEQVRVKSWNTHGHRFSPDGKWIAYNISDNEYNSDIWLVPARGGKPVNVTSHPDSDYGLRWAESGRALVFVSGRGKDRDVWHVWLRAEDALLSTVERAEQLKKIKSALAERRKRRASARSKQAGAPKKQAGPVGQKPPAASAGKPAAPTGPAKPKKSAKPVAKGKQQPDLLAVRVDGEELFLRVQRVSRLPGDESNVCVDPAGTQVLFTGQLAGKTAIFRAKYDGSGLRTLVPSVSGVSRMRYGPMGRKVYYLGTGGVIGTLDPASGRTGKIDFEARLLTDRQHVRSQKFEECWRLIRDWFYDAKYHGADWHKLRRRYRSLALTTRHLSDFNFVIKLMLGELNASHVGISGPRSASSANEQSGELGIDLDPGHIGPGLRVAQVLAHGPSMRRQARLEPGDILLGVDGHPIGPRTNLWQLLIDTAGQPVRLSVKRGTQTQMIEVRPVSAGADRSLRYREWVSSRRALVDKLSGGKLGYIHIQGMNWSSLERFERDLYARAHGKQGLLVDVRYNGGGWTTDQLLVMLQTKAHAFTVGRGGGKGYPQGRRPFYAWQKPVGLLCNEMSFSNAEIFSHAFRTLELGPIVGQPTYGGVISTGAATLIDGARFRMPGRGWYVWPKGQDMEFYGARPHHLVVQTPDSENAGADPQLERAVKVLLEKK